MQKYVGVEILKKNFITEAETELGLMDKCEIVVLRLKDQCIHSFKQIFQILEIFSDPIEARQPSFLNPALYIMSFSKVYHHFRLLPQDSLQYLTSILRCGKLKEIIITHRTYWLKKICQDSWLISCVMPYSFFLNMLHYLDFKLQKDFQHKNTKNPVYPLLSCP